MPGQPKVYVQRLALIPERRLAQPPPWKARDQIIVQGSFESAEHRRRRASPKRGPPILFIRHLESNLVRFGHKAGGPRRKRTRRQLFVNLCLAFQREDRRIGQHPPWPSY